MPADPLLATVPAAPRKPSPRALSMIFEYDPMQAALRIAGVLMLLIGLMTMWAFARGLPTDIAISLFGKTTTGTLVSKKANAKLSVNGRHPVRLRFHYVVSGADYESESSTMHAEPSLDYSRVVDVEYVPFAPELARISGTTFNDAGWSIAAMMVVPIVGACLVAFGVWKTKRRRRAFIDGVPAVGTITLIGTSNTRINGQRPALLRWSFSDEQGRLFDGSLTRSRSSDFVTYFEGSRVVVLYDPNDPSANTIYVE